MTGGQVLLLAGLVMVAWVWWNVFIDHSPRPRQGDDRVKRDRRG